jgi:FkbM family methyltransferase
MKPLLTYVDPLKKQLRRVLPYWAVSLLRSARAKYSFQSFKPRIVRHQFGKYDFQIELVDFDGAQWFDQDYDENFFSEIPMLQRNKLVPGAKVFDVGANQCLQAMMMAKEVAPGGFVWAVEPGRRNVGAGIRNCELNGIKNVRVIQAAASSNRGQLWFDNAMNGRVATKHEPGTHLVEVVTVDDMAAEFGSPDVLYVDVEGFECEVLEGARATLAQTPDCFIEVHLQEGLERFGGSTEKVLSFFPTDRYELYFSEFGKDGVFRPIEKHTELPQVRFFLVALARSSRTQ